MNKNKKVRRSSWLVVLVVALAATALLLITFSRASAGPIHQFRLIEIIYSAENEQPSYSIFRYEALAGEGGIGGILVEFPLCLGSEHILGGNPWIWVDSPVRGIKFTEECPEGNTCLYEFKVENHRGRKSATITIWSPCGTSGWSFTGEGPDCGPPTKVGLSEFTDRASSPNEEKTDVTGLAAFLLIASLIAAVAVGEITRRLFRGIGSKG